MNHFQLIVTQRIAAHKAEEARKEEAQRAQIRAEEQAKAERDAREKLAQEQAEAARIQREQEAARRRDEENAAASNAAAALAVARERESFTPELQADMEAMVSDLTADLAISRAAEASKPISAPAVVQLRTPSAPATPPTLKLGDINARFERWSVTEANLAALGFPATKVKGACLHHDSDFSRMLDSIVAHARMLQNQQRAA